MIRQHKYFLIALGLAALAGLFDAGMDIKRDYEFGSWLGSLFQATSLEKWFVGSSQEYRIPFCGVWDFWHLLKTLLFASWTFVCFFTAKYYQEPGPKINKFFLTSFYYAEAWSFTLFYHYILR